jgi:hypothetical protein
MIGFIGTSIIIILNCNELWQLTINKCLRLASFLTGLRASSIPLWLTWFWFTNRPLLQLPMSWLTLTAEHSSLLRMNLTDFSSTYDCRLTPRLQRTHLWIWVWVITTDGQSASLSWNKAPIWGLRPDFYYWQTVSGLLMWGALSDERTGLSFTTAPDPRQRSHFRVRVPWDSWPYFTVSDSRLPFSSPPTVKVFDPASTRETYDSITCSRSIPRCEPNREHYLQQFTLFLVYPLLCKRVLIS